MYIKWALAPSGYYICVAEFNNKHYYASGRTVDILEKNIKRTLYMQERVSATQVHLEQTKSEQIDLQYASKMFMAKFVRVKPGARPTVVNKTLIAAPKPQYEYITEQDGNEMVVYELREVARYKLHTSKLVETPVVLTPETPVCDTDTESQVEYL
jgi:hypothetical protein